MDTNNENQINELFAACEQLNNVFCSVYNIAVKCSAPDGLKTDLSDTVSELHNQIFRIANFISMGQSESVAPELDKKLDDYLEFVADTFCKGIDPTKINAFLSEVVNRKN